MPMNIGPMELIIVLVIALIVLGPKRLPEAGRSVGKGLREFKESLSGERRDDDDDDDVAALQSTPRSPTSAKEASAHLPRPPGRGHRPCPRGRAERVLRHDRVARRGG